MDSKEAMRRSCQALGVKGVADNLGISPTAIYNQINDKNKVDILRRFVDFCDATENNQAIRWACEELNGVYIANPSLSIKHGDMDQNCISSAVREFGEVLQEIGAATQDGQVTQDEAVKIRKEWEDLKRLLEGFVLACECGYMKTQTESQSDANAPCESSLV